MRKPGNEVVNEPQQNAECNVFARKHNALTSHSTGELKYFLSPYVIEELWQIYGGFKDCFLHICYVGLMFSHDFFC